jgi:hypothetical protein
LSSSKLFRLLEPDFSDALKAFKLKLFGDKEDLSVVKNNPFGLRKFAAEIDAAVVEAVAFSSNNRNSSKN